MRASFGMRDHYPPGAREKTRERTRELNLDSLASGRSLSSPLFGGRSLRSTWKIETYGMASVSELWRRDDRVEFFSRDS